MQSMQRLLPRMALAKQASNVIHPMLRLLDGEYDELRRDAVRHSRPHLPFHAVSCFSHWVGVHLKVQCT